MGHRSRNFRNFISYLVRAQLEELEMKNTTVKNFMLLDGTEIVLLISEKFYPSKKWTCVKFASGQIEWV